MPSQTLPTVTLQRAHIYSCGLLAGTMHQGPHTSEKASQEDKGSGAQAIEKGQLQDSSSPGAPTVAILRPPFSPAFPGLLV